MPLDQESPASTEEAAPRWSRARESAGPGPHYVYEIDFRGCSIRRRAAEPGILNPRLAASREAARVP
jgi:hypothetical protein